MTSLAGGMCNDPSVQNRITGATTIATDLKLLVMLVSPQHAPHCVLYERAEQLRAAKDRDRTSR
jgi:hypothetical protein